MPHGPPAGESLPAAPPAVPATTPTAGPAGCVHPARSAGGLATTRNPRTVPATVQTPVSRRDAGLHRPGPDPAAAAPATSHPRHCGATAAVTHDPVTQDPVKPGSVKPGRTPPPATARPATGSSAPTGTAARHGPPTPAPVPPRPPAPPPTPARLPRRPPAPTGYTAPACLLRRSSTRSAALHAGPPHPTAPHSGPSAPAPPSAAGPAPSYTATTPRLSAPATTAATGQTRPATASGAHSRSGAADHSVAPDATAAPDPPIAETQTHPGSITPGPTPTAIARSTASPSASARPTGKSGPPGRPAQPPTAPTPADTAPPLPGSPAPHSPIPVAPLPIPAGCARPDDPLCRSPLTANPPATQTPTAPCNPAALPHTRFGSSVGLRAIVATGSASVEFARVKPDPPATPAAVHCLLCQLAQTHRKPHCHRLRPPGNCPVPTADPVLPATVTWHRLLSDKPVCSRRHT